MNDQNQTEEMEELSHGGEYITVVSSNEHEPHGGEYITVVSSNEHEPHGGEYMTVVSSNEHEYCLQPFYCSDQPIDHVSYEVDQKPDISGIIQETEEMIVEGPSSELLIGPSRKGRGYIKNAINSTTEKINQYLVQMVETKQTRQRLANLLQETNDFELNLKNQLKAEIEKGNGLKQELKSVTTVGEEYEHDNLDTTDVERFLEQLDNESKMNCLFVECISAGPTDEGDYDIAGQLIVPEISYEELNPSDFMAPASLKRKSVRKEYDDILYEPRIVNREGRIAGKRGRKRGSYKKRMISDEVTELAPEMTAGVSMDGNDEEFEGSFRTVKQEMKSVYMCPTCGETFPKLYLKKKHEAEEHPIAYAEEEGGSGVEARTQRMFQCSMCKMSFLRLVDRTHHEENEHLPTDEKIAKEPWRKKRTFKCHMCDAIFPWFKDMQKHVRDEHYAKDPNMCDVCGKTFVTRFVLKNHKKLHAPVRPFPCSECPKSYKTNGELKSHFRVHTGEKPFKCSECDKSFSNSIQRKIHQRDHTGERPPYVCSECHYEFHLRGSLVKHMRIHTGERPYLCADCGKSFTESSGYKVHLRLHTGVRPYVCTDCGKSYVQSERLKTHQRTHTGEKRYACTVCGMRYMYSRGLRDHMEKHAGEVKYACNECNRKFVNEMTLGKHMRKHIRKEVTLEYYVVDGEF